MVQSQWHSRNLENLVSFLGPKSWRLSGGTHHTEPMQSRTRRTGFSRRSIHVRRRSRYLSCLGDCYVGLVMVLSYVGLGTKLHEAGRSQARSLSLPKRAKKRCSFRLFFGPSASCLRDVPESLGGILMLVTLIASEVQILFDHISIFRYFALSEYLSS